MERQRKATGRQRKDSERPREGSEPAKSLEGGREGGPELPKFGESGPSTSARSLRIVSEREADLRRTVRDQRDQMQAD